VRATKNCSVYAIFRSKAHGKVEIGEDTFAKLVDQAWDEVNERVETNVDGPFEWRWRVLRQDIDAGDIALNLENVNLGNREVLFIFKAQKSAAKSDDSEQAQSASAGVRLMANSGPMMKSIGEKLALVPLPEIVDTKASPRIKELQQKRLTILEEIRDSAKQLYADSRVSYEEVHGVQLELLAARIAYVETQKQRIKACDEAMQEATAWQQFVRSKVEAGKATRVDELKANAFLLETQIAREKAATAD